MTSTGFTGLFRPRRYPDEEQNASSDFIHWVCWILIPIAVLVLLAEALIPRVDARRPIGYLLALILCFAVVLILNYRGWPRLSGIALPVLIWSLVTVAACSSGGIRSPDMWFYPFVVLLAGFAGGSRNGLVMGILCCLTTLAFSTGLVPSAPLAFSAVQIWILTLLAILSAAGIQYLAADTLRHSLRRASHELAERKRAEQALMENEQSYRAIVQELGDGVGTLDEKGCSLVSNPALEGIFGVGPGGLLGRNIREFLQPADRLIVEEEMRRRRLGETGRYQVEILRGDGTRRTIHVTATPNVDAAGRYAGAVTIVRDVTDPRMLEGQIRLLAHALGSAGECIWIADPDGKLLYLNEALQRTFGYKERTLLGRCASVLASDRNQPAEGGIVPGKLTDGWRGEVWCRTKDGRDFPMEVTTSRVRDEHGAGIAWVGVGRDVTLERQAQATLRESERRFREHLEKVQLAAVMIDRNGSITFSNDYFLSLSGWTREEVVGSPALKFIASEDQSRTGAGLEVLRERARVPLITENTILTKAGQKRLMQWNNTPLLDAAGNLTGFCGLGVDMTEHRALMEHRHQSERLESVGRLAAGVAHDFNNLLTVINGYSDMALRHTPEADPRHRSLQEIRNAGEQAAALTSQLLTFSRQQVVQPGLLALNQVILESESMFEQLLRGRISLVTSLAPDLGHILADKAQLQQVLMNLMTNAMYAMPDGGSIHVETSISAHPEGRQGDWVLLTVRDTGIGMDQETLAHIFEPFFTARKDGTGTGLGLAIVYGIVRQSNGHLTVESQPGAGTTFRIWWPCADALHAAADRIAAPEPVAGSETVLVVEDRREVRDLVVAVLQDSGYRVLAASCADRALQLVAELREPIDLLLTDIVMPGMNGRELAALMTARDPDLKVLFMSGYAADVIPSGNLPDSGIAFIQKPLTAGVLSAKVRQVLDAHPAIRNS